MKFGLLVTALALAAAAPVAAANVAVNGSFETGDFTGWTQFGNTGFTAVASFTSGIPTTDGAFAAYFGPVGNVGGISQTFSAGTYNVSFDLSQDGGSFSQVDFGGTTLLSNVSVGDYSSYNFTVTVGANSALSFSFQNDPSYYYLDNVVVDLVAGGVPEPTTWALLITGFGFTGATMRRRRTVAA